MGSFLMIFLSLFGGISVFLSWLIIATFFEVSYALLKLKSSGVEREEEIKQMFGWDNVYTGFNNHVETSKSLDRLNRWVVSALFFLFIISALLVNANGEYVMKEYFDFSAYFSPLLLLFIPVILWCLVKVLISSNWTKIDYFLGLKY